MEVSELQKVLEAHAKWWRNEEGGARANLADAYLAGANLADAYLAGANLADANLAGANLAGANLAGAYLARAYLARANLAGAYLAGAYLAGANLADANLAGANLAGAYLARAKLSVDTVLETGETWKQYLGEVLPALLTAGGRTVQEILAEGAWDCHQWSNCPMACAFRVRSEDETPLLLRPRVRQFVRLFDAYLIPRPDPVAPASPAAAPENPPAAPLTVTPL